MARGTRPGCRGSAPTVNASHALVAPWPRSRQVCCWWCGVRASHRHRRTLFAPAHHIPQIDDSGRMMANAGIAIARISGTVCLPHRKRPASNALILEDMDGVSLASSWQLPSTKDARYFRKSTKDARYSRKFTKDARHFQKYINNAQQFRKPIKHAHDCRGFIRIAN